MAKIKISFNGVDYQVDESALADATTALRTHLSTVINGEGATITLGNQSYNIDSEKLSAATNNFVAHLGTISGSGSKVSLGGREYNVDSTKLASAISDLGTVFGGLENGESGDSDSGYATFNDGARLTFEELKLAENGAKYGYDASKITDTTIGYKAFWCCASLTEVNLPNVTNIGEYAFNTCESLTTVNLPNVTTIGEYAFWCCASLTEVNLPNVTNIGRDAFSACESLTTVNLPNATSIGINAFSYCISLTKITFNGTTAEWNAISKGYNWNYQVPATYVQCSDGQVSLV